MARETCETQIQYRLVQKNVVEVWEYFLKNKSSEKYRHPKINFINPSHFTQKKLKISPPLPQKITCL